MKKYTTVTSTVFIILLAISTLLISSCAEKVKEDNTQLFTAMELSSDNSAYLNERGLLEADEDLVYLYYLTDIKEGGILLTNKKVAVFTAESIDKELMQNIFDLSSSHAVSTERKSRIKVFRKDDTSFSYGFPGGLDIDETFFASLRTSWRTAISEKQATETKTDSTDGMLLGVKKQEENN